MILVTCEDGRTVVQPPGENLVAAGLPELRARMHGIIGEGVRDLAVDLASVRMVDSSGLGLLMAANNSLRKVGGRFAVIHASEDLLALFQSMRMNQHFSVTGK
jgi:anti-sigma B factor antagonist